MATSLGNHPFGDSPTSARGPETVSEAARRWVADRRRRSREVISRATAAGSSAPAWGVGAMPVVDARGFMQRRVALYLRTLFLFFVAFLALNTIGLFYLPDPLEQLFSRAQGLHVVTTAALALGWWLTRRGARALSVLTMLETSGTVAVCASFLLFAPRLSDLPLPHVLMVMLTALVMVVRAGLVPSSALRTALIGLVLLPMVYWAGLHTSHGVSSMAGVDDRQVGLGIGLVWHLAFAVAATLTSKTIYGLHEKIRATAQLGQYTLVAKVGEGGMGVVYRASHAMLRRPTAIKLLPPDKAGERALARFEREVQQTCRLTHPNTVQIFDFGRTPDGVFYYAMEFLDGVNLEELVEIDGPQPPGRVVYILRQVAGALAEAHDIGLIHRDVKPANVLLCQRGGRADVAKVVDFGLVKDLETPTDLRMSTTDVIKGTPLYLAPESLTRPHEVDGRMDLYAVGAVGFYMLTGEPPFSGRTLVEVCGHHLHTPATAPSLVVGVEPTEIDEIILRCLAKDPGDRFPSALDLAEALDDCSEADRWDDRQARAWWAEHAEAIQRVRRRTESEQAVTPERRTVTVVVDRFHE